MSDRPLLSIVIPTKDRYNYLKYLIKLIVEYNLEQLEIIIQDNSADNSDFYMFVEQQKICYLKYYHDPVPISVSSNVDKAILNSTGEYVCFIGDDDGVLPNIIECASWMKQSQIDALRPAVTIYNWPDFIDSSGEQIAGALLHDTFTGEVKVLNVLTELQQLAKRGFRHIYTLPKVYQGIVKRSCLDKIYAIGQTFCPGPSPDMATAVALCFVIDTFVTIDTPVILIGQCKGVGGGERTLRGGVKRIEDVTFLPTHAKQNWDIRLPKVWCSQTVWPESAIKALEYMQKTASVSIDFEYIYAWFIQTHPTDWKLAWQLSSNKTRLMFYLSYYKLWVPLINLLSIIRGKQGKYEGREHAVRNLLTINEAVACLKNNYASKIVINNTESSHVYVL